MTDSTPQGDLPLPTSPEQLLQRFKEFSQEARGDDIEVEEEFRRITRRYFKKSSGVKPVVIPLVYEV